MLTKEELLNHFDQEFGDSSQTTHIFFAPGRVNLIGEHTDYNQGYVMPFAINNGTYLLIRPNNMKRFRFKSLNLSEKRTVLTTDNFENHKNGWWKYPLGIINEFKTLGFNLQPSDFLFYGTIPDSAGLSSSASVEMVTATGINYLLNAGQSALELVLLAKRCENNFIGLNCGIMDMFAIGMGRSGDALQINCDTLHFDYIPVKIDGFQWVVCDTKKQRLLSESKYNERVEECQKALNILNQRIPAKHLSAISLDQLTDNKDLFSGEEILYNRALHIISENQRVFEMALALKDQDINKIGQLMTESHKSLQFNYEVSGLHLDTMVHEALQLNGVRGARMTGAGFGGCAILLAETKEVDSVIIELAKLYLEKTGLSPAFYKVEPSDGSIAFIEHQKR